MTERVVDLTSADGTKLKGTFFAATKPSPGVLLLHQCNKDRKIWDSLGRRLAASGMNVLTFDLRTYGESEGEPMNKLSPQEAKASIEKWPADVDAAFEYLISQPGVKRDDIGIGGASCGVNNSVQAAIRHPEVKSLVLLAGPTDLAGRNFLRHSHVPVLFGFADDDEFPGSILETEWLYELTASRGKRLVRYANGGHGAEIFRAHPDFEDTIRNWFATTLIGTPGRAPASKRKPLISMKASLLNLLDVPGGAAKLAAMQEKARKGDSKATLLPESIVNQVGYEHLQAKDTKVAIEIMKFNAEAYPNSANVYDSLSDAYLADGQNGLALANAQRALETLTTDSTTPQDVREAIRANCERKVKQLSAKKPAH